MSNELFRSTPRGRVAVVVAFTVLLACTACGSPESSGRAAVILEPERIPHQKVNERYDVSDGTYVYTMRHPSTECAYRDIRGDLGVQVCGDMRLILQKFSVTE